MTIKLFGITKEIIGSHTLTMEISDNMDTVSDLKQWLSQQYPALCKLTSLAIAVDAEYADDAHAIHKDSEVALMPPVSGG